MRNIVGYQHVFYINVDTKKLRHGAVTELYQMMVDLSDCYLECIVAGAGNVYAGSDAAEVGGGSGAIGGGSSRERVDSDWNSGVHAADPEGCAFNPA